MKKSTVILKTPICYYGGKTQLLSKILPLIPAHTLYSEVFFGGGSVFFAKEPAEVEVINDINKMVVNFYKVAKQQFTDLQSEIDMTLYAEEQYQEARQIYFNQAEQERERVLRAWALFVLSHQTFLHNLENSWAFSKSRNVAKTFTNKKEMFDERYIKRLDNTQIFCRDAIRVLKNVDLPTSFHFIDPPYYNSDCGHYGGYTLENYRELLTTCETLEGKFLLTSYPSDVLEEFRKQNNWFQLTLEMHKSASAKAGEKKTEVFTMNFVPSHQQLNEIFREVK